MRTLLLCCACARFEQFIAYADTRKKSERSERITRSLRSLLFFVCVIRCVSLASFSFRLLCLVVSTQLCARCLLLCRCSVCPVVSIQRDVLVANSCSVQRREGAQSYPYLGCVFLCVHARLRTRHVPSRHTQFCRARRRHSSHRKIKAQRKTCN